MVLEDSISHKDSACGDGEGDEPVQWCAAGEGTGANVPLEAPDIGFTDEEIRGISDSCMRYSDMVASVSRICDAYRNAIPSMDAVQEMVNNISTILLKLTDYASVVQGMYSTLAHFAENLSELVSSIDLDAIMGSLRTFVVERRRADLLMRTNWPLFMVDDDAFCNALDELAAGDYDEGSRGCVLEIASEHLDEEWLDATLARWGRHDELSHGVKALLGRAIARHKNKDYEGCVALLMNLFEGLIEKYLPKVNLDEGQIEEFDAQAKRHGLRSLRMEEKKLRRLGARDRVLLLMMLNEDGMFAIRCAVDYIVDVVLTGTIDDDLASHNPLRNKICHGDQTEYGTEEHSLKAILATDIMIRLGSAVLAVQVDVECGTEEQGQKASVA